VRSKESAQAIAIVVEGACTKRFNRSCNAAKLHKNCYHNVWSEQVGALMRESTNRVVEVRAVDLS